MYIYIYIYNKYRSCNILFMTVRSFMSVVLFMSFNAGQQRVVENASNKATFALCVAALCNAQGQISIDSKWLDWVNSGHIVFTKECFLQCTYIYIYIYLYK